MKCLKTVQRHRLRSLETQAAPSGGWILLDFDFELFTVIQRDSDTTDGLIVGHAF